MKHFEITITIHKVYPALVMLSLFTTYYASKAHNHSTRFATNENWSLHRFKKPLLNVQLDTKALYCGMRFLQA